jgi:hypothetical protein
MDISAGRTVYGIQADDVWQTNDIQPGAGRVRQIGAAWLASMGLEMPFQERLIWLSQGQNRQANQPKKTARQLLPGCVFWSKMPCTSAHQILA